MAMPTKAQRLAQTMKGKRVITVFGSINLDLIGGVGRCQAGRNRARHDFATAPGGKGANQALAAARAGAAVRMVGAVGRDAFADQALPLLRASGVDLSACANGRSDGRRADPGRSGGGERHRRHPRRQRHGERGGRRRARVRRRRRALSFSSKCRSPRLSGGAARARAGANVLLNLPPTGPTRSGSSARHASHRERERVRPDRGGPRPRRRLERTGRGARGAIWRHGDRDARRRRRDRGRRGRRTRAGAAG